MFGDICMGFMHSAYGVFCFAWVLRKFLNIQWYMHRFYAFRVWRLVFCMGFKEIPKYSLIYAWVLCTLAYGVLCFAWVLRNSFDILWYMHGFYALSTIFIVCCMGFIALLIFGCVLHGFYGFVDIWLCFMGFSGLLIFDCVLHGF